MSTLVQSCGNPFQDNMAHYRPQEQAADSGLGSPNRLDFSSAGFLGFSFHSTEPLREYHSDPSWSEAAEGPQYFHGQAFQTEEQDGYSDILSTVSLAQMSQSGTVQSLDSQLFSQELSTQWISRNSSTAHTGALEMERWTSQSSVDSVGTAVSRRTTLVNHEDQEQSLEQLRQSLTPRMSCHSSHRSDTSEPFMSLTDPALCTSRPQYMDHQSYSELPYQNAEEPSAGYTPRPRNSTNGVSRHSSLLLPVSTDGPFSLYANPAEEITFSSPVDMMSPILAMAPQRFSQSQNMSTLEQDRNGNPIFVFNGAQDFPVSRVTSPTTTEHNWSASQKVDSPTESVLEQTSPHSSPRTSRRSTVKHMNRSPEDFPLVYHAHGGDSNGLFEEMPLSDIPRRSSPEIDNSARDHPLYQNAKVGPDALYHCPWEGKDPQCTHKPEKLKCNYEYESENPNTRPLVITNHPRRSKSVDSHLKPYRCKVHACENARFSSTACLLRHEREAHAMHGHGEKPFLCRFDGCDRGIPGNGFPRHWNLRDHMKRVHNLSPSPTSGKPQPTRGGRKRKAESTDTAAPASKKSVPEPPTDPYWAESTVLARSLNDEWQQRRRLLLQSVQLLEESDPMDANTMLRIQLAGDYLKDMHRTTQLMNASPDMSRTKSQQSG